MLAAGSTQRRIARTLNSAYAGGLLSEDTFLARTDQLLGGGVIDPARLVGDLNFRHRRGPITTATATLIALIHRRPRRSAGDEPGEPLLALDWSGAQSELLIGRDARCDIVLPDPSVSRLHARLRFRDGRWILHDLDSTNGSEVNGARVGRCVLAPGDEIALGDQRFTVD